MGEDKGMLKEVSFLYFIGIDKLVTLVDCDKFYIHNLIPIEIPKKIYINKYTHKYYNSKLNYKIC